MSKKQARILLKKYRLRLELEQTELRRKYVRAKEEITGLDNEYLRKVTE